MALEFIDASRVARLLPMTDCIGVMREAMIATSAGTVDVPLRQSLAIGDGQSMLIMPGAAKELGYYGSKLITLHADNPAKGLPSIQGFIALFDFDTGEPRAIIDGASVTGLRTAAASGLATDLLSRRDATTLGIYGIGLQAKTHIDAVAAVRPISNILVWGRNHGAAKNFAQLESVRTGLPVRAVSDPEDVASCDILCTVTGSPTPVLRGNWVAPGTHVNLVGSHSLDTREADTVLIKKAKVYVDSMRSTIAEGGNIMIPISEGAIDETHIVGEIGQAAAGDIPCRTDGSQITVYSSLGVTSQDLYAAAHIYGRLRK